jgi:two-component system, chemotaxis family, protein-glutamate methylesterase/glutaminase
MQQMPDARPMKQNSSDDTIRVLVVDDSALMSRQITGILTEDNGIEVVGTAKDGIEALSMAEALKPDVITMDVEMPRMNGITALKHIMVKHSIPTVMISALTREGARTSFDALKYGAIDVIAKPSRREDENLSGQKADIIAKVRRAAEIRTGRSKYIRMGYGGVHHKLPPGGKPDSSTRVVGIGAGTGGYYALLRIVPALPDNFAGVMIAVVLVAGRYIDPFVSYLDAHSAVQVKNAVGAGTVEKGTCYVCSGQEGLVLDKDLDGTLRFAFQGDSAPDNHGPVDRMLGSLSVLGDRAVGVVLTGAGDDGARGMVGIRASGGIGVVQEITNALDPSMPLAVLQRGSVDKVLADYRIAGFIAGLGS